VDGVDRVLGKQVDIKGEVGLNKTSILNRTGILSRYVKGIKSTLTFPTWKEGSNNGTIYELVSRVLSPLFSQSVLLSQDLYLCKAQHKSPKSV
jgi:hypothetical protein